MSDPGMSRGFVGPAGKFGLSRALGVSSSVAMDLSSKPSAVQTFYFFVFVEVHVHLID